MTYDIIAESTLTYLFWLLILNLVSIAYLDLNLMLTLDPETSGYQ